MYCHPVLLQSTPSLVVPLDRLSNSLPILQPAYRSTTNKTLYKLFNVLKNPKPSRMSGIMRSMYLLVVWTLAL